MKYLGTPRMVHCPSFGDYFRVNAGLQLEAFGYGYVIGYNYHGGHTNTPWPTAKGSTATWISPQKLTDPSTSVVISDMNDWSIQDRRTFAPHGRSGPILLGGDVSNRKGSPGVWRGNSAQIGAAGGNLGLLDGSVSWKKIGQMQIYRGSQIWVDGCIAMW